MRKKFGPSDLFLIGVLLLYYLPILVVILFSFNDSKLATVWSGFSLRWYEKLFSDRVLLETLKNSLILAGISCGVSAVIGTVGAVGLVRSRGKLSTLLESVSIIPIMIPEIILGMAFLAFFSYLSLKFGMLTLVLAHTAFCVPYILLSVKGALVGMDQSLTDAAQDLGATSARAFWDVTLPEILPSVLSGVFIALAMSLDDVVISFFVAGPTTNTLPVKIYSQLKMGVTPEINALCSLMLAASVVLVLLALLPRRKK